MNKNPFSELVEVMREEGSVKNPPTFSIGTVTSESPLKIKTNDLELDQENNILINYNLLDHTQELTEENLLHVHSGETITYQNNMTVKQTLKVGDKVIIFETNDGQTYIIMCKVVAL